MAIGSLALFRDSVAEPVGRRLALVVDGAAYAGIEGDLLTGHVGPTVRVEYSRACVGVFLGDAVAAVVDRWRRRRAITRLVGAGQLSTRFRGARQGGWVCGGRRGVALWLGRRGRRFRFRL